MEGKFCLYGGKQGFSLSWAFIDLQRKRVVSYPTLGYKILVQDSDWPDLNYKVSRLAQANRMTIPEMKGVDSLT